MKSDETKGNHGAKFIPVRDSRNRKVKGLYQRNGRYYGLLWAEGKNSKKTARRFPLRTPAGDPCASLAEAKEAFECLRGDRRENSLPRAGRKPSFAAWADTYLAQAATRAKKLRTVQSETLAADRWKAFFGSTAVDKISTPMLADFMERRLSGGRIGDRVFRPASPRTVSLDFIMLRNILKSAQDAGYFRDLPRFPALRVPPPPRRSLITPQQFDALLAGCLAKDAGEPVTKNGEQLRDFMLFLAFTGCREQEGLRMKWHHVDFVNRRVFVGAAEDFVPAAMTVGIGGESKNRGSRVVDFNPQLETHLLDMAARRAPDCSWVFPSPQRGDKDIPARSLRESLRKVRAHVGMPTVGFHDFRHLFCSFCVMTGIDFMTIAAWLGHKDGGILVGKVYGHLLDEHRQKAAAQLRFETTAVPFVNLLEAAPVPDAAKPRKLNGARRKAA